MAVVHRLHAKGYGYLPACNGASLRIGWPPRYCQIRLSGVHLHHYQLSGFDPRQPGTSAGGQSLRRRWAADDLSMHCWRALRCFAVLLEDHQLERANL
jgi:hypothetical protein